MTDVESGSLPAIKNDLSLNVVESAFSGIITGLIDAVTTTVNVEDVGETPEWTRGATDLVSRLLTAGITPLSDGVTSDWLSLLMGTSSWGFAFLTIPVFLAGIIWYFILTFVLKVNVVGAMMGRNLGSSATTLEEERQENLDTLTRRISHAVENPR